MGKVGCNISIGAGRLASVDDRDKGGVPNASYLDLGAGSTTVTIASRPP